MLAEDIYRHSKMKKKIVMFVPWLNFKKRMKRFSCRPSEDP